MIAVLLKLRFRLQKYIILPETANKMSEKKQTDMQNGISNQLRRTEILILTTNFTNFTNFSILLIIRTVIREISEIRGLNKV
jgi:hypothetical protein